MEEREREEQSSLRPLVQHSLPNSTDVTVVTTKKETFGECEEWWDEETGENSPGSGGV